MVKATTNGDGGNMESEKLDVVPFLPFNTEIRKDDRNKMQVH